MNTIFRKRFTFIVIVPFLFCSILSASIGCNIRLRETTEFESLCYEPWEPMVLAYYYGWYGDENQDWNHWDSSDPVGWTTWFLPILGVYSSLDDNVLNQHVDWAKQSGIHGFIFSWWHGDWEREHFREGLEKLLDIAEEKDFKITVYLESEDNEYSVADQIDYLIEHGYCDRNGWYYKDDKPVFFVWIGITSNYPGKENEPNGYWSQVHSQIDREIYLNLCDYSFPYEGDALHFWINWMDDYRLSQVFGRFLYNVKNFNKGDYSVTVNPGFDNTMPSVGGSIKVSRDNADRYRAQWESALNISTKLKHYPGYYPDEILIVTWNDWHETTSIEPCDEWGFDYLNITAEYAINKPPNKPSTPIGPNSGKIKTPIKFNTNSTDKQGDQLFYNWHWGDGNYSGWLGPFFSDEMVNVTYQWYHKGDYIVMVKAKDNRGLESEWSDYFKITITKNKILVNDNLLDKLINFPNLMPNFFF
jgi:hypothetical protein